MIEWRYLLAPALAYVFSAVLKFVYRIFIRGEEFSLKHLMWMSTFGDGAPSMHMAVAASMATVIWEVVGTGPLFYFVVIFVLFIAYDVIEARRKQVLLEEYFKRSDDPAIRKIVSDKILMDMSGHNLFEVFVGAGVGILSGILASWF